MWRANSWVTWAELSSHELERFWNCVVQLRAVNSNQLKSHFTLHLEGVKGIPPSTIIWFIFYHTKGINISLLWPFGPHIFLNKPISWLLRNCSGNFFRPIHSSPQHIFLLGLIVTYTIHLSIHTTFFLCWPVSTFMPVWNNLKGLKFPAYFWTC